MGADGPVINWMRVRVFACSRRKQVSPELSERKVRSKPKCRENRSRMENRSSAWKNAERSREHSDVMDSVRSVKRCRLMKGAATPQSKASSVDLILGNLTEVSERLNS